MIVEQAVLFRPPNLPKLLLHLAEILLPKLSQLRLISLYQILIHHPSLLVIHLIERKSSLNGGEELLYTTSILLISKKPDWISFM